MNQTQAIARLRKIIGARLAYRVDNGAPTAETRAQISSDLKSRKESLDRVRNERKQRADELLSADLLYCDLLAKEKAASEIVDKLRSSFGQYRITVGKTTALFFHVMAYGDNWQEVVDQMKAKAEAQR